MGRLAPCSCRAGWPVRLPEAFATAHAEYELGGRRVSGGQLVGVQRHRRLDPAREPGPTRRLRISPAAWSLRALLSQVPRAAVAERLRAP